MEPQDVAKLEAFIELVKTKPETLQKPEFAFFKNYVESLGARLPTHYGGSGPKGSTNATEEKSNVEEVPVEEESEESDVELDESEVVAEDEDLNLEMGDAAKEVSEADQEKLSEIRGQATEASNEGNLEAALNLWTEAIKLNPKGSVLFAKRAQVLSKMNKPKNAIKDASKAIELNPDQPLAYRIRGLCHGLLGHWEQAASDLNTSLNIDYSEEANEWLKKVAGNAKKLHDHKRKMERKRDDREMRERQERIRKAQEERKKAAESASNTFSGSFPGGFPGMSNAPGGGIPGMPGGMQQQFASLLQDPEVMAAFQDPEVATAFQEISSNPANMMKYQNNPKVMTLVTKLMAKMGVGGAGGMGGDKGGMGNMFG